MAFCARCGAEVPQDLRFCTVCGEPQPVVLPPPPPAMGVPAVSGPPIVYTPRPGVSAQTGKWISESWSMVTSDLGMFSLLALLMMIIGAAGAGLLNGPLNIGMNVACLKKLKGRAATVSDLFAGFPLFVPALIASLLISLLGFAGFLLCIIPGIVVAAALMFSYHFIMDKRMDFWPAMQASHEVVKQDYVGFVLFLLAMGLVNFAGLLCCFVGLFVTIPMTYAATTIAYNDVVGFEPDTVDRFPT